MGARSSNAKISGWAVTQRRCLNGSTIPAQGPTSDAKLAAMGRNRLASSIHPCFIEASPTVEKAVSWYKADWLIASLLSFCRIQLSLAVRKFHAAGEEHCEQGNRWVCANLWCLMLWCPKCIGTIATMWAQGAYLQIHYANMVGSYTENPEKPQNCQNWGMGACMGMGAFPG